MEHPRIRTFHPRRSRTTPRAASALAALSASHVISVAEVPGNPSTLFDPALPVALEIGPGMGAATLELALAQPGMGVLAVDVHTPGIGALLAGVRETGAPNIRVCIGDALEVMDRLAPASLAEVRAFFPDPWPKVRHHKRRLVNGAFVSRVSQLLIPGGRLHLATDVADYAATMLATCSAEPRLLNLASDPSGYLPAPTQRPITKYEQRARDAGRTCHDLIFVRTRAV